MAKRAKEQHFDNSPGVPIAGPAVTTSTIQDASQGVAFTIGEVAKSIIPDGFMIGGDYTNPDELVKRQGHKVFDRMLNDDLIGPLSQLKKLIILSFDWRIKPFDSSLEAARRAEFVNHCLTETMSRSFNKVLNDILDAHFYGFSLAEKNFAYIQEGEYLGMVGLKSIRTKPQSSIEFKTDEFGNLGKIMQVINSARTDLPADKFIHYAVNQQNENPYGKSILARLYNVWFIKTIMLRLYPAHVERHGSPTTDVSYPAGYGEPLKREIHNAIRKLQFGSSFTHPTDVTFKYMHVPTPSSYPEAIGLMNKFIARGMGVPDLFGFTDISTGTRNLGLSQFDLMFLLSDAERSDLLECINYQLIPTLEDINFPKIGKYSTIAMTRKRLSDAKGVADLYSSAISVGGFNPTLREDINKFRSSIGLEEIEETQFRDYLTSVKPYLKTGGSQPAGLVSAVTTTRFEDEPPTDPEPDPAAGTHDHADDPTIKRNIGEVDANLNGIKTLVYEEMDKMSADVLKLAVASWEAGDIEIQSQFMESMGFASLRDRIAKLYTDGYTNGTASAALDLQEAEQ